MPLLLFKVLTPYAITVNTPDISGVLPGTKVIQSGDVFVANSEDPGIVGLLNSSSIGLVSAATQSTDAPGGVPTLDDGGFIKEEELPDTIGGETAESDVATESNSMIAESAYPQAVTNKTGAAAILAGGSGVRVITINDYTDLSGASFSFYLNAVGFYVVEGAGGPLGWTAAVSNNGTAISLAAAISNVSGLIGKVISNVVYIEHTKDIWSFAGQADSAPGAVMSWDALQASDSAVLPVGYLGGAVDGGILLGGSGSVKLSTVGTYEVGNGLTTPNGFARLTGIGGTDWGSTGLQIWPLDYADGFTDTSYTALNIYFSQTYGGYIQTSGVGSTQSVPPLYIGTAASHYSSDSSQGFLSFVTLGYDRWYIDATSGDFITQNGSIIKTPAIVSPEGGSLRLGGKTMAADAVADSVLLVGSSAKANAASNKTGGSLPIAGGLGSRKITILDYTLLAGITVWMIINDTITSKTEGSTWTAGISNAATASSLASTLNSISGISANAVGDIVYITKLASTYSISGYCDNYYSPFGLVMSFDMWMSGDNLGATPPTYSGGAVEGSVTLGGTGNVRIYPAPSITYGVSPFGILRITQPLSNAQLGDITFDNATAGIQCWPLDYNNGYTDDSYEEGQFTRQDGGSEPGVKIRSLAVGAGRTVGAIRISTGQSVGGSDTTGADIILSTLNITAVTIDTSQIATFAQPPTVPSSTGSNTLVPTWTNFPGSGATKNPDKWLKFQVGGHTYYVPAFE